MAIDLAELVRTLTETVEAGRMARATKMLRDERFQLYAAVADDGITGVVRSQRDEELVYACRLAEGGVYWCCTQNLVHCGGSRGAPCKHVLVLALGLAQSGRLAPERVQAWAAATHGVKPALDREAATATFVRYKGAEAGQLDWRPTETIPEDFYAL